MKLKLAEAAVEMARYYEDARRLAGMVAKWAQTLPGRRHRFVVTSGGGPGISPEHQENVFDPSDVVTMIRGKHVLHFGGEFLFYRERP